MKPAAKERASETRLASRSEAIRRGKLRTRSVITTRERQERAAILRRAGLSTPEIAQELGFYWLTIHKDLKRMGLTSPRGGPRPKYPEPSPRVCARPGCGVLYTPRAPDVARGKGRFCSRACVDLVLRLHPDPGERVCARPGCGTTFRPDAHKAATGRGLYCSRRCRDQERIGRVVKRVAFACAECGREKYVFRWELEHGRRFCSLECFSRWRGRRGSYPVQPWWSANAKRRAGARRGGALKGGKPPGKLSWWNEGASERLTVARAAFEAEYGRPPTLRELEARTGIPRSTISRLSH